MNKKQIAFLLATSIALTGASGCKQEKDYVVVNESSEVISQTMLPQTKTFEPGTHCLQYWYRVYHGNEAFIAIPIEVPDGYELIDVEYRDSGYAAYIFKNNLQVEATGFYNEETGIYEYNEPGTPVTQITLKPRE